MISKTRAIALRYAGFSETSRMVTWLTADRGKIATSIKGSQRPKSPFLGQYDLFYTCELLYYTRQRNDIHIARECCPLKTRASFRSDWKAAAAASYLCDFVSAVSVSSAPQADVFQLLDTSLDTLAERGAIDSFIFWFELQFLGLLGLAPRLQRCLGCQRALAPGSARTRFSYARGGILCNACAENRVENPMPIAPAVLATLVAWQRSRNPQAAFSTRSTTRQLTDIEQLLGLFIGYHLDTSRASRPIALDIIRRKVA